MFHKRKWKNQQGFSLVELSLVAGIIGLLTLVATDSMNSVALNASRSEARVNIKQMWAFSEIAMMEYQNQFPLNSTWRVDFGSCSDTGGFCSDLCNPPNFTITAGVPDIHFPVPDECDQLRHDYIVIVSRDNNGEMQAGITARSGYFNLVGVTELTYGNPHFSKSYCSNPDECYDMITKATWIVSDDEFFMLKSVQ